MAVVASEDPKLALEDMRVRNKVANKALASRARTAKTASHDTSEAPGLKLSAFTQADNVVSALDDKTQLAVVELRAESLGMRVVSEGELEKLIKTEKATQETGLEGVKFYFDQLKPSEKMQLVDYAAAEVGVEVHNPMENDKSATVEELTDIPENLRRKSK